MVAAIDVPLGDYTLRVRVDGADRDCTFSFPIDEHSFDAGCTVDSRVSLVDGSGSADRRFSIVVEGTPDEVWVGIRRGDDVTDLVRSIPATRARYAMKQAWGRSASSSRKAR